MLQLIILIRLLYGCKPDRETVLILPSDLPTLELGGTIA